MFQGGPRDLKRFQEISKACHEVSGDSTGLSGESQGVSVSYNGNNVGSHGHFKMSLGISEGLRGVLGPSRASRAFYGISWSFREDSEVFLFQGVSKVPQKVPGTFKGNLGTFSGTSEAF